MKKWKEKKKKKESSINERESQLGRDMRNKVLSSGVEEDKAVCYRQNQKTNLLKYKVSF